MEPVYCRNRLFKKGDLKQISVKQKIKNEKSELIRNKFSQNGEIDSILMQL